MLVCALPLMSLWHMVFRKLRGNSFVSQSFSIPLLPRWDAGKLLPISTSLWTGGRVHPGQVVSPSQGNTLIHTPKGNLESHVFGLWVEARVPGKNPRMHGENMQTPCRNRPRPGVEPRNFLL
ncbi:hypothetical protein XENOCAPTIV_026592 [Xenoophorus captivus]|uniref:Secreted protein n=1 Tax=Xenoophorus captivus TaxID=1517983 RepID=A0ABV0QK83_9TELE